jgi:predicted Rossmann-fold nucleotide-binding protein
MPEMKLLSREWSLEHLLEAKKRPLYTDLMGKKLTPGHAGLVLRPGGTWSYTSTQPKKPYVGNKILTSLNADIEIRDPIPIVGWFLSADEKSRSFIGNAFEKAEAFLNRVEDLGYETVATNMRKHEADPENHIYCVNDCGAYFNTDFSLEPEFAQCLSQRGIGPWPGVEFSPVTDARGGLHRFFSALDAMRRRKEKAGETVDLTGYDHQTYLFFKLARRREDVKFFSFEAAAPIKFVTAPVPFDDEVLTSFHFTEADDDAVPKMYQGKTRAQYEEVYMTHYSGEAAALREFMKYAQIPTKASVHVNGFNAAAFKKPPYSFVTQHNVLKGHVRKENGSSMLADWREETRSYDSMQNDVYENLTSNADAVILGPHDAEITSNWDHFFPDISDLFFSLAVNKQVLAPAFENTPWAILNRKKAITYRGKQNGDLDWNDPGVENYFMDFLKDINPAEDPWLQHMLLLRYFYEKGMMKQEQRFIYDAFEPADPALAPFLQAQMDKIRRKTNIEQYKAEAFGSDAINMFEVTLLGSASTRAEAYTSPAFDFGHWVVSKGWHLRTGGGRYGIMGAGADGALDWMANRPRVAWRGHLSAIQMPRTLQFEGACIDLPELKSQAASGRLVNKFLKVEPDFDRRMRNLFRSHALVVTVGGPGTFQEISRFLRLQAANDPLVLGKKMIVVNPEQPDAPGHAVRLMDPYLAICPKPLREHLIVVPDMDGAKFEVESLYKSYYAQAVTRLPEYNI